MISNKNSFIKTAFLSLNEDQFDEVVRIFQESYMHNVIVNVNGTNDYGKDLVIYQNKREVKRCVQITIEKDVEKKIRRELPKVKHLIEEYGFSSNYEFYCNSSVSEGKIEDFKKKARDEYEIELDFYDSKRLSQLPCKELKDYIFSLYDERPGQALIKIDESKQMLFNLLTSGSSTGDIKKSLIQSVIVFAVFEKTIISIPVLQEIVGKRIKKHIPNIQVHLNELIKEKQIQYSDIYHREVELTDEVSKKVAEIYSESQVIEKDFSFRFREILDSYGISEYETVMQKLQELYSTNYQYDIDETNQSTPDFDKRKQDIYNEFESYLMAKIDDRARLSSLIQDIKTLCDSNSYLNRSVAGGAFISLYSSDKLEDYINNKKKWVYLDTPVFVYYICSRICADFELEWKNVFFNSTKSLLDMEDSQKELSFFVSYRYIKEAIGQLSSAVNIGWMEDLNLQDELGESRNTFYQCYRFLKRNSHLVDDPMDTIEDFLDYLGIDCRFPDTQTFFREAYDAFADIAEQGGIEIVSDYNPERFEEVRRTYETQLAYEGKTKSYYAVESDVKQTLYLLDGRNFIDPNTGMEIETYLATWDESFFGLRKALLSDTRFKYKYFYVQNPSKLANKFAIENFNIDVSCISNDIFMYAENEYQISSKVRNLIDLVSQLLNNREKKSVKVLGWLRKVRRSEIEQLNTPTNFQTNQHGRIVAIDEVMDDLLRFMRNGAHRDMFDQFSAYILADENYDAVVELFEKAIDAKNRHKKHSIGEEFLKRI